MTGKSWQMMKNQGFDYLIHVWDKMGIKPTIDGKSRV